MRCPRCDARLKDTMNRCNQCGQDLSIIKQVYRLSNAYYNIGLEKATVRDLSGAVNVLRKSLQFNKNNVNARNLLGLVLYEMGETVSALSEWVLSKYLQPEENEADYYIRLVQDNPQGLEAVNQTIKKYNAALSSARSSSEDLAIIQLKKVVSLNPKFVRAHQLLALLYMKAGDYGKAYKSLKRARKIDYNNTTTLRYIQEVGQYINSGDEPREPQRRQGERRDPLANVTPVGTYKEEKRQIMPVILVVIGIMVGILVSIVLIRPTLKNTADNASSEQLAEANSKLTAKDAELDKIKAEKSKLEKQLKKSGDSSKSASEVATGGALTTKEQDAYQGLLNGVSAYLQGQTYDAALEVSAYKKSDFKDTNAKYVYKKLSLPITNTFIQRVFDEGRVLYNSTKYDEAIVKLLKVEKIAPKNQDVLYFIGRSYERLGKTKKAIKYYTKVTDVSESTTRGVQANTRLDTLGKSSTSATATPSPY